MIPNSLLIDTFIPQTLTVSDDGMGGRTSSWSNGTTFKGRLSSLSSDEKRQNDKVTLNSTHKLFCNHFSIDESSRIINSASTRTFEIKGIINPSNSNHHLELMLNEIETSG